LPLFAKDFPSHICELAVDWMRSDVNFLMTASDFSKNILP